MEIALKVRNVWRRLRQSWGSSEVKRAIWNSEFSQGDWDHLPETPGDCVYGYVEKYARNGDILDLGCGSGNTGSELNQSAYQSYIGVDISDVAIEKAMWRSERAGRDRKNRYVHADIVNYSPEGRYDVILFRESLYYVPRGTILKMLRRYREHLKEGGVIIVRLYDRDRYNAIHRLLRKSFGVLEEFVHEDSRTVVLVFR